MVACQKSKAVNPPWKCRQERSKKALENLTIRPLDIWEEVAYYAVNQAYPGNGVAGRCHRLRVPRSLDKVITMMTCGKQAGSNFRSPAAQRRRGMIPRHPIRAGLMRSVQGFRGADATFPSRQTDSRIILIQIFGHTIRLTHPLPDSNRHLRDFTHGLARIRRERRETTRERRETTRDLREITRDRREATERPRETTERPREATERPREATKRLRETTERPREARLRNMEVLVNKWVKTYRPVPTGLVPTVLRGNADGLQM